MAHARLARVGGTALAIALTLATTACGSEKVSTEAATPDDGWEATAPFDASVGFLEGSASTIWTGSEIIIVNGLLSADQRVVIGSPAYDPSTDSWRTISAPPIEFVRDVLPQQAVWTGTELLVLGPTTPPPDSQQTEGHRSGPIVGAGYDPVRDTWRVLTPPPADYYRIDAAVWTGDQLLTWTETAGVATYDPSSNAWTSIEAVPSNEGTDPAIGPMGPSFGASVAPAVWDGSRLVVFDGYSGYSAAFDPIARTWSALPAAPFNITAAVVTGNGLLAFDSERGSIATLDPTAGSWEEGATAPFTERSTPRTTAWTGQVFAVWAGLQFDYSPTSAAPSSAADGATYDPSTNTWVPMSPVPDPSLLYFGGAWAGDAVFTWGTTMTPADRGGLQAAMWRP